MLRTVGISPKAVLAFLYPFVATVAGTIGSWVVTGDFNDAEVRTAVGGLIASAVAYLGAYVGAPGNVKAVR
ncbi:MAG: hypothetical protein LC798_15330 [Chloroflexi bacterium]|nr:hypothetical protein [Chloroflexota bacterium]